MFPDIKSWSPYDLKQLQSDAASVFEKAKSTASKVAIGGLTAAGGSAAYAAGPDLSTVTAAVDFGTVVTAVLGVAAALIVVHIAWKGAKMVIAALKGG